jgi:hypothetical protein
LVGDYCHHEKKVETERPEDKEFGAFQVAAWDGVFFGGHELIVFEGGEDQGLVDGGDGGRCVRFGHRVSRFENSVS